MYSETVPDSLSSCDLVAPVPRGPTSMDEDIESLGDRRVVLQDTARSTSDDLDENMDESTTLPGDPHVVSSESACPLVGARPDSLPKNMPAATHANVEPDPFSGHSPVSFATRGLASGGEGEGLARGRQVTLGEDTQSSNLYWLQE